MDWPVRSRAAVAFVTDRDALSNELEQLGAEALLLWQQTWGGTAKEPADPEVRAIYEKMRQRLVAAGYSYRHADQAVTSWIFMRRYWTVLTCADRTDENGPIDYPGSV